MQYLQDYWDFSVTLNCHICKDTTARDLICYVMWFVGPEEFTEFEHDL